MTAGWGGVGRGEDDSWAKREEFDSQQCEHVSALKQVLRDEIYATLRETTMTQ